MANRTYRQGKKGAGKHVQLHEWLQASEAWASLRPGPRALYIELKRLYNGSNNGQIFLSHRDAADAINVHRNTIGSYFSELEQRGFIRMTQKPHLGLNGSGQASVWALEEVATNDGKPAGKAFIRWKERKIPAQ